MIDACNLFHNADFDGSHVRYAGIGRGRRAPDGQLVRSVVSMYRAVVRGVANELEQLVQFLNERYADDVFNRVDFNEVRRFAATCSTGCDIDVPGDVSPIESHEGFVSGLAQLAADAAAMRACAIRGVDHARRRRRASGSATRTPSSSEQETPWPLTPRQ